MAPRARGARCCAFVSHRGDSYGDSPLLNGDSRLMGKIPFGVLSQYPVPNMAPSVRCSAPMCPLANLSSRFAPFRGADHFCYLVSPIVCCSALEEPLGPTIVGFKAAGVIRYRVLCAPLSIRRYISQSDQIGKDFLIIELAYLLHDRIFGFSARACLDPRS